MLSLFKIKASNLIFPIVLVGSADTPVGLLPRLGFHEVDAIS